MKPSEELVANLRFLLVDKVEVQFLFSILHSRVKAIIMVSSMTLSTKKQTLDFVIATHVRHEPL